MPWCPDIVDWRCNDAPSLGNAPWHHLATQPAGISLRPITATLCIGKTTCPVDSSPSRGSLLSALHDIKHLLTISGPMSWPKLQRHGINRSRCAEQLSSGNHEFYMRRNRHNRAIRLPSSQIAKQSDCRAAHTIPINCFCPKMGFRARSHDPLFRNPVPLGERGSRESSAVRPRLKRSRPLVPRVRILRQNPSLSAIFLRF